MNCIVIFEGKMCIVIGFLMRNYLLFEWKLNGSCVNGFMVFYENILIIEIGM